MEVNKNQAMTEEEWFDLLERFIAMGGVAKNVCQKNGALGRGIFPTEPSQDVKIMTPRNILIDRDNIEYRDGEIIVKDPSYFTTKEKKFLEYYYNNYSWGNGGDNDSKGFLTFLSKIDVHLRNQLVSLGFIDKEMITEPDDKRNVLSRFIDERAVGFEGRKVLAPIWEFVNHCSFSPSLRITPNGVETPPIKQGSNEILFKYSSKNSPISMWKKYGFACKCIVAYSIPFTIKIKEQSNCIKCDGLQGLTPSDKNNLSVQNDIISIKSLPIGCLSKRLPLANLKSTLLSSGLTEKISTEIYLKVCEINLKARKDILRNKAITNTSAELGLYKAMEYEIDLIKNSMSA